MIRDAKLSQIIQSLHLPAYFALALNRKDTVNTYAINLNRHFTRWQFAINSRESTFLCLFILMITRSVPCRRASPKVPHIGRNHVSPYFNFLGFCFIKLIPYFFMLQCHAQSSKNSRFIVQAHNLSHWLFLLF